MTDEPQPRPRSGVLGRAWADLPLRAKGLVVVAIPVRIPVQAGVTGYVLTEERRYLTSYQEARQELPRSIANLGALVSGNVERILGYTQDQVLATPRFWFDRLHPQDRDRAPPSRRGGPGAGGPPSRRSSTPPPTSSPSWTPTAASAP